MNYFDNCRAHAAYNLDTREVMLYGYKRGLRNATKYRSGRWVFAHGENALQRVCDKALGILKTEGVRI